MQINEYFSSIKDPRIERSKLHSLSDIFGLTIIANICGIKSWEEISYFGELKQRELSQLLEFKNGVPSHDTLERVFSVINPKEFNQCFFSWAHALCKVNKELISIDGKVARNSFQGKSTSDPLYLVNAWATKNRIVLAQYKVESKGYELVGIKELLKLLNLYGSVISIDALGCQKDIAQYITEQNSDYILAVKDNQPLLKNDIVSSFSIQQPADKHTTVEKNSGRVESRTCSIINNFKHLSTKNEWPGLKSIIRIESERSIKDHMQKETRYYISSLKTVAKEFNESIRSHWGIENSLHWTLDVLFEEDKSRKRKGATAENFSLINKITMNILRNDTSNNLPLKRKQLKAAHDFKYLKFLLNFDA